jgi:cyclopropane fatty-acyl-phospholipid synthase-like methyltransferase
VLIEVLKSQICFYDMETTDSRDYFESYEDLTIHQLMLKDSARNRAYRQAIFDNADQIRGRTVLDVGAGTGILSVLCAQAGAAKVYAVEASSVWRLAQEVISENRFDNVVEVINSRIEDAILPEKVDVIVSEWMGFHLLHEGMLDSVIAARDKFLKPGGLIFPESATLYSAPCWSVPHPIATNQIKECGSQRSGNVRLLGRPRGGVDEVLRRKTPLGGFAQTRDRSGVS